MHAHPQGEKLAIVLRRDAVMCAPVALRRPPLCIMKTDYSVGTLKRLFNGTLCVSRHLEDAFFATLIGPLTALPMK